MIIYENGTEKGTTIKVVGVGGAGCNAVNRMVEAGFTGVEFIAINTDAQVLEASKAPIKIQIGKNLTKGLGAGTDPEIGRQAAEEDSDEIRQHLEGADMVFITAGMGGGTGTGASPVIAEISRELGILTVAIVTKPFPFEGKQRMRRAEEGIKKLKEKTDTIIVIPNERLLKTVERQVKLTEAFKIADEVLMHGVQGISDLVTSPGLINVDFADVAKVMRNAGEAWMGVGIAHGENRAQEAVEKAIKSPLLEDASIDGATLVLLNIAGGEDLTIGEVEEISNLIFQKTSPEAEIILGTSIDENLEYLRVTVIATGFKKEAQKPVVEFPSTFEKPLQQASFRFPTFVGDDEELPSFLKKNKMEAI